MHKPLGECTDFNPMYLIYPYFLLITTDWAWYYTRSTMARIPKDGGLQLEKVNHKFLMAKQATDYVD